MRTSCLPQSLLAFFLFALVPAWAGELPADFADACGPASAKMQEAYEHATIHGNCRLTFPKSGRGATQRTIDFVLRTDGDQLSLTESGGFEAADSPTHAARPPRELEINGREARLREGDGAWESTDMANAWGYIGWVTQIRHVYGKHLVDFLRNPARTIDSVENLTEDDRPIVRLSCHWDDPATGTHNTGTYDFLPSEGWALVRYVNTWHNAKEPAGRYTVHVDYDGLRDGVPLIRRAEEALAHGPKFETDQLVVVDFIDVQFAEPAALPSAKPSGPQAF